MPTITEYIQQVVNNQVVPVVGAWVQFVDNSNSSLTYVSQAVTTSTGLFTIQNLPAGTYTVNVSSISSSGPWTSTGDTNYFVGADVHTTNTFTIEQDVLTAGGRQIVIRNSGASQNAGASLYLKHDSSALPNAGHEEWILLSERSAGASQASNTRAILRRQNPTGTVAQDYIEVDETGKVRIADNTLYNTGNPNPSRNGVSTGPLTATDGDIVSSLGHVTGKAVRAAGFSGQGGLFAGRFVGITSSGSPTSVPSGLPDSGFEGGDFVVAQGSSNGMNTGIWVQVLGGVNSPGTWYPVGPIKFGSQTVTNVSQVNQAIPSWCKHFMVEWEARDLSSSTVGQYGGIRVAVSGGSVDSGNHYNWAEQAASATSVSPNGAVNGSSIAAWALAGGGDTQGSDTVATGQIWCHFANTSRKPQFTWSTAQPNFANQIVRNGSGIYWNASGPITTLYFFAGDLGNFNARFDFYGYA